MNYWFRIARLFVILAAFVASLIIKPDVAMWFGALLIFVVLAG